MPGGRRESLGIRRERVTHGVVVARNDGLRHVGFLQGGHRAVRHRPLGGDVSLVHDVTQMLGHGDVQLVLLVDDPLGLGIKRVRRIRELQRELIVALRAVAEIELGDREHGDGAAGSGGRS